MVCPHGWQKQQLSPSPRLSELRVASGELGSGVGRHIPRSSVSTCLVAGAHACGEQRITPKCESPERKVPCRDLHRGGDIRVRIRSGHTSRCGCPQGIALQADFEGSVGDFEGSVARERQKQGAGTLS